MKSIWLLLIVLSLALSDRALSQTTVRLEAGNVTGTFTSVGEVGTVTEIVEHKIIEKDGTTTVRKIPGVTKQLNAVLRRPVSANESLWAWRKMVETGQIATARRTCKVILLDETGTSVASFTLTNGWPASINLQTVNGVLMEEIVLACEDLTRDQP